MAHLEALGLAVTLAYQGTIDIVEQSLEIGLPVIVNVKTVGWTHWHGEETYHAVVVIGIDRNTQTVYIHDPFFAEGPLELPLPQFLNGWEEQDRQYVIIGLAR